MSRALIKGAVLIPFLISIAAAQTTTRVSERYARVPSTRTARPADARVSAGRW